MSISSRFDLPRFAADQARPLTWGDGPRKARAIDTVRGAFLSVPLDGVVGIIVSGFVLLYPTYDCCGSGRQTGQ
ncbi:MAG: hypothetical protein A2Z46_00450 [Nitrospirae bacterium RBG_19FT_COMBO_55_12]|nr:MAG: hypothetical protein A2Z46_00450 [Nitrospirae bacterium RBG_19FT_COMBO_55_12]